MMESAQVESSVPETPRAEPERKAEGITRLVSLDAFRGIVMILMLAEQMRLPEVARAFPHSALWRLIAFNTEHVEWQGCSLHDLIQPGFYALIEWKGWR
jgi:predicted acyltransferase